MDRYWFVDCLHLQSTRFPFVTMDGFAWYNILCNMIKYPNKKHIFRYLLWCNGISVVSDNLAPIS